jgi:hypothetical protein
MDSCTSCIPCTTCTLGVGISSVKHRLPHGSMALSPLISFPSLSEPSTQYQMLLMTTKGRTGSEFIDPSQKDDQIPPRLAPSPIRCCPPLKDRLPCTSCRSMRRRLDQRLYLLVKRKPLPDEPSLGGVANAASWSFPTVSHETSESIRYPAWGCTFLRS